MGPSSCVQLWVSSLGNPGDRGDRLEAEFKPACHQFGPSHGSWSGISDVLLALALALLFAREKGQAEAPARRAEGQRVPQGLGPFGDTALCGWRSSQHAHSCWPGARELAASLGGKAQTETPKQAQPKGAGLGTGRLCRWQALAAMAGGQQGSAALLSLTQQIPLEVHQGLATCGCSRFDPDLGVLETGLISTRAPGVTESTCEKGSISED